MAKKKLYKLFTTGSKAFFTLADDPTSAENLVLDWMRQHDWSIEYVSSIEVIAEADEYTKFSVLVNG